MKQVGRIAKIILVFFTALVAISCLWYVIGIATLAPGEKPAPLIDYILYLLGFGDLNVRDHYLQTLFSTLGLLSVTLLSSVFTVSLFELRRKVMIGKTIRIVGTKAAELELRAAGKDLYHMTATLISKCGSDITTQEQYFPFVAKKERLTLDLELAPGTPLYKYLRAVYTGSACKPQLILTVVYADIASGQEYTMAQKYQLSDKARDFAFSLPEEQVKQAITAQTFPINLATVVPCVAEDIDLSYGFVEGEATWQQNRALCARVHMTSDKPYIPDTFTMAVTKDLLGNDWTKYYDLGCALKFSYRVRGNIRPTLEFKYGQHPSCVLSQKLEPTERFAPFTLHLHRLDREKLANVAELCFTVFYRDTDPQDPTGEFVIRDCVLEVEGPEKTM